MIYFLFLFIIVWCLIYHNLNSAHKADFAARYVSCLHALVCWLNAAMFILNYVSLESFVNVTYISIYYCLFDTAITILNYDNTQEVLTTIFHHFTFAFLTMKYAPIYPMIAAQGYLSEISNPYLHYSFILYSTNEHRLYPYLFKFCGVATLVFFFIFRVLNFTHLGCTIIMNNLFGNVGNLITFGMMVLNYYWFVKLCRVAKKNL